MMNARRRVDREDAKTQPRILRSAGPMLCTCSVESKLESILLGEASMTEQRNYSN